MAQRHTLSGWQPYPSKTEMRTDTNKNEWLTQLEEVLKNRLSNRNLSNPQLAKRLNMSERQFYRKVLKTTGKTPNQYFTQFRMKKALELMQTKEYKTVREIAFALGYKKDSYFSNLFKQEYGVSPLERLRELGLRKK